MRVMPHGSQGVTACTLHATRLQCSPASRQPMSHGSHKTGSSRLVILNSQSLAAKFDGSNVVSALQVLHPALFPSQTAAKNACRRREVLLDGQPVRTTTVLRAGQLLELTQRSYTDHSSLPHLQPEQPQRQQQQQQQKRQHEAGQLDQKPDQQLTLLTTLGGHQLQHAQPATVLHQQSQLCKPQQPQQALEQHTQQQANRSAVPCRRNVHGQESELLVDEHDMPSQHSDNTAGFSLCENMHTVVPPHPPESSPPTHIIIEYEDEYLAVVSKPQGMPTQGTGQSVHRLASICLQPSMDPQALRRPHHVHRLDAPTGGLVMVAKTRPAQQRLCTALAERRVDKRYLAIVKGRMEGSGVIDMSLAGEAAVTHYTALQHTPSASFGCLTTLSLWPKTGRNHQLRKHLAYSHHPILGDLKHRGPRAVMWAGDTAPVPGLEASYVKAVSDVGSEDGMAEAAAGQALSAVGSSEEAEQLQMLGNPAFKVGRQRQLTQHTNDGAQQILGTSSDLITSVELSTHSTLEDVQGQAVATSQAWWAGMRDQDVLCDGSKPELCLWAVELRLQHPISGTDLHVTLMEPAEFQRIRQVEARGC